MNHRLGKSFRWIAFLVVDFAILFCLFSEDALSLGPTILDHEPLSVGQLAMGFLFLAINIPFFFGKDLEHMAVKGGLQITHSQLSFKQMFFLGALLLVWYFLRGAFWAFAGEVLIITCAYPLARRYFPALGKLGQSVGQSIHAVLVLVASAFNSRRFWVFSSAALFLVTIVIWDVRVTQDYERPRSYSRGAFTSVDLAETTRDPYTVGQKPDPIETVDLSGIEWTRNETPLDVSFKAGTDTRERSLFHFSNVVPEEWERVPSKTLQERIDIVTRLTGTKLEGVVAMYTPIGNQSLSFPYIVVRYEKDTSALHALQRLTSTPVSDTHAKLASPGNDKSIDASRIDVERHALLLTMRQTIPGGNITCLTALFPGTDGIAQLSLFTKPEEAHRSLRAYNALIDSFRFDRGFEYHSSSLSIILHRGIQKAFHSVIGVGVLGLLLSYRTDPVCLLREGKSISPFETSRILLAVW